MIQSKCSGHITLIFSIHDSSLLPRAQGSRGVGICLEDGVRVELVHAGKSLRIQMQGPVMGNQLTFLPSIQRQVN